MTAQAPAGTLLIDWHAVGASGSLISHAVMGVAVVGVTPGLNSTGWLWYAAVTGAIGIVHLLIRHRQSAWWWLVWPVICLVRLAAFGAVDQGAAHLVTGVIFVSFVFAGLTQPRGRSLLLVPLATGALFSALDLPLRTALVHLAIAAVGWTLAAELPALVLRRVADRQQALLVTSETDSLTGARNRHGLADLLQSMQGRSFVVIVDLDHFKKYNDTYGHLAGDRVLSDFAATLRQESRHCDVVVRYGGEEFLILLADADQRAAELVVRRWTTRWEQHHSGVTFSAGIAELSDEQALNRADRALYSAKADGRARTVVAPSPVSVPVPVSVPGQRPVAPPAAVAHHRSVHRIDEPAGRGAVRAASDRGQESIIR